MGRLFLVMAAFGVPLQAMVAVPAAGLEIVVCTGEGARTIRLDEQGRPVFPGPSDKARCLHFWCEPRRQRAGGLQRR